jgi:hypothetical protein
MRASPAGGSLLACMPNWIPEVDLMPVAQEAQVQVQVAGVVPDGSAELAETLVGSLLRHVGEPVLFARVRLTMAADPAVKRPAIARAVISVNGRLVRAQTADATMRDAVHHLKDRLRVRLEAAWPPPRRTRARAVAQVTATGGRASAGGAATAGDAVPLRKSNTAS